MQLYTLKETMEILKISRSTLWRYIKQGKIKTIDMLGNPRISKEEIEKIVKGVK